MEKIVLDGRCLKEKAYAHRYLKEKLMLPDYYGNNLDALWDMLTETSRSLEVSVLFGKQLLENGGCGAGILKVFLRAEEEMEDFHVILL